MFNLVRPFCGSNTISESTITLDSSLPPTSEHSFLFTSSITASFPVSIEGKKAFQSSLSARTESHDAELLIAGFSDEMLELLLFALQDLRDSLKDRGSNLMIRFGNAENVIQPLATQVVTLSVS